MRQNSTPELFTWCTQEETYGKKIQLAHRETVESEADSILQPAKTEDVAFLVVGDPFGCVIELNFYLNAGEQNVTVFTLPVAAPPPTRTCSYEQTSWASR